MVFEIIALVRFTINDYNRDNLVEIGHSLFNHQDYRLFFHDKFQLEEFPDVQRLLFHVSAQI